jgi:hypothetical protein
MPVIASKERWDMVNAGKLIPMFRGLADSETIKQGAFVGTFIYRRILRKSASAGVNPIDQGVHAGASIYASMRRKTP